MMDKVTMAIEFAAKAHDGMCRKKDKTPYILHPLEASVRLGAFGADDASHFSSLQVSRS